MYHLRGNHTAFSASGTVLASGGYNIIVLQKNVISKYAYSIL
jgi:hypothetical protein